ncbi:MAG: hypothetical protein M0Z55_04435 [Peptococcaceae bacterium]|nr:hypothetical protein [Peptococcaceae bacterium]
MAKRKWSEEEIDEYRKNHNMYFIYYDEEDTNLFVPRSDAFKRWSITGLTVNFAHPIAIIFVLIILTLIILPVIPNILWK